jgi:hypothetical protein
MQFKNDAFSSACPHLIENLIATHKQPVKNAAGFFPRRRERADTPIWLRKLGGGPPHKGGGNPFAAFAKLCPSGKAASFPSARLSSPKPAPFGESGVPEKNYVGRYSKIGTVAVFITLLVTLPRTNWARPVRPWVDMAIRSNSRSRACSTISWASWP